jgi:hypothetical protein
MSNKLIPKCSYTVFVRYRQQKENSNEVEFLGSLRVFQEHPENPILDRESAFKFRDTIIESLLDVINIDASQLSENAKRDLLDKHYFHIEWDLLSQKDVSTMTDGEYDDYLKSKRAETNLNPIFIEDGISKSFDIVDDSLSYYSHYNEGIWVIMEHNDLSLRWDEENNGKESRIVIDKIDSKPYADKHNPPRWMHLEEEYKFYKKHNLSTIGNNGKYDSELTFFDDEEFYEGDQSDALKKVKILKTPFDWTGFDQPFWWGEPKTQQDWEYLEQGVKIEELKKKLPDWRDAWNIPGENQYKEFKPALHFNFKTGKRSQGIMHHCAKSIAAFLNTNGGFLFIGVNDKGEAIGLEKDFSCSFKPNQTPHDYFLLQFDYLMSQFFNASVAPMVHSLFHTFEKEIFIVMVEPSPEPIFLRTTIRDESTNGEHSWKNVKEFYVRQSASSKMISDPEEIVKYCKNKWFLNK